MRLHNLGCHLRTMTISFTDLFMFQVANTENSINLFSQAQTHTCKQRRKYCFMLNHTHRDTHSCTSSCIMNTNKQSAAGTQVHTHTHTHTHTPHTLRLSLAGGFNRLIMVALSSSIASATAFCLLLPSYTVRYQPFSAPWYTSDKTHDSLPIMVPTVTKLATAFPIQMS